MRVKVCGMTDPRQVAGLEGLGASFAGFIFYEKSARFVVPKLDNPGEALGQTNIKRVGVFVNAPLEEVRQRIVEYGLDLVQLHGDESPDYCRELQAEIPVIKAVRIGEATNLEKELERYEKVCDYFLFDTDSRQYGGTGQSFNWELLQNVSITKPFFLSGGIGPDDHEKIKAFQHPRLFALDLNSRFETAPGQKNMDSLKAFLQKL